MAIFNSNTAVPVDPYRMGEIWNKAARLHVAKALNSDGFIASILADNPDTLYHYTPLASLEHILKPHTDNPYNYAPFGSIRAGCSVYMNDTNEYTHGESIVADALRASTTTILSVNRDAILTELEDLHKREERRRQVFLSSLSMVGDLKSQWMEYADAGRGISIGFDAKKGLVGFNDFALRPYGQSYPVVYDDAEKARIARLIIESFAEWFESDKAKDYGFDASQDKHQEVFRFLFGAIVASYVPLLKNSYCHEEKEWRNVVNNQYGQHQNVTEPYNNADGTRRIKDGVELDCVFLGAVQYQFIDPPSGEGIITPEALPVPLPIVEIIIGPKADFDATKAQVEAVLTTYGYGAVPIRRSSVPYAP